MVAMMADFFSCVRTYMCPIFALDCFAHGSTLRLRTYRSLDIRVCCDEGEQKV